MRGPHNNPSRRTAVRRLAPWLVLFVLLAACDSSSPVPSPTPVSPSPAATPAETGAAPGAQPSPEVGTGASQVAEPLASPAVSATWASTLRWRGSDLYLLGVNYPYHRYGNDFGSNAWGSYGVHDPATYAEVDSDFAQMSSMGIRTVRWFVFADARAGITFDASGQPSGLDPFVFQDLDAALEIAQRHNLALDLVLLDFRFMWDAQNENGVQMGGHASVLATQAGQQALVSNAFVPLFKRYAHHPAILSWEVMNEPEWGIMDAGRVNREITKPLTLATFRDFARLVVDAIHADAGTFATIGSADMKWAQNWVGLGLDYYQIHYYDWMKTYSTDNLFAVRADSLHLDRPIVIGEFPAEHSTVSELPGYLDTWYANGYAGAWPWSFRTDGTWGTPDPATMRSWADAHRQAVGMPAAASPGAGPAGTPAVGGQTYTVVRGDNLTAIARRFGTTAKAIMNANALTSSVIHPGQVLILPSSGSSGVGTEPPAPSAVPPSP